MDALLHVIEAYGLWVVFLCVVLDQGGLPLPAYPVMIVTSGLAVDTHTPVWPILLVAVAATVAADLLWYSGGRRFGAALLRLMCRISLSPDSCIGRTRRLYGRWGAPSLILAKYIPGFAAVATTLAGETHTSLRRFLVYDAIGAALWAGGADGMPGSRSRMTTKIAASDPMASAPATMASGFDMRDRLSVCGGGTSA